MLDRSISGENRSTLLSEHVDDGFIYSRNGILEGYYLASLGEGLIVANTVEAGLELMKLRCSKSTKATLPKDNIAGIRFLTDNGFRETNTAHRMIKGKEFIFKPEMVFNRIFGYLG